MTPALKAMVEAIAAEFERQENEAAPQDRVVWSQLADDGKTMSFGVEGGRIDLEKVARAGLAAIHTPPVDVQEAGYVWDQDGDISPADQRSDDATPAAVVWRAMIDAILGEKP